MKTRGFLLLALLVVPACGTDGYTPACPELVLYDIGNPAERAKPDVVAARNAAIEAGCVTAPASAPPPASGGGGSGDSGGSGNAGGTEPQAAAGDGGAAPTP
jgi:hypothetical protein